MRTPVAANPAQTLYDYGGDGPPLNIAIANGFPPQVYAPFAAPLTQHFHAFSLLPRPLWRPAPPPERLTSWADFGTDLLAELRARDLRGVVGVGHSFGGVATMLAAIEEPSRFRAVVLLDPTIFPPNYLRLIRFARLTGLMTRQQIVTRALARRAHFATAEEAFAYWRPKRLFHDWDDAMLRRYVDGLTEPAPDGDSLTLTWTPAWEARIYALLYTESWRMVPRLRATRLPVLVLRGATTDTFVAASAARFRKVFPEATLIEIPGVGHLFPQAAPSVSADAVHKWLISLI